MMISPVGFRYFSSQNSSIAHGFAFIAAGIGQRHRYHFSLLDERRRATKCYAMRDDTRLIGRLCRYLTMSIKMKINGMTRTT